MVSEKHQKISLSTELGVSAEHRWVCPPSKKKFIFYPLLGSSSWVVKLLHCELGSRFSTQYVLINIFLPALPSEVFLAHLFSFLLFSPLPYLPAPPPSVLSLSLLPFPCPLHLLPLASLTSSFFLSFYFPSPSSSHLTYLLFLPFAYVLLLYF